MSDFSPSEFLRKEVYPRLDAVEANLLNGLDPKPKTNSGSYPLTCPACKAKEGFYYPTSAFINCPRKNECGKTTSVWDAMLACGYTQSEIFSILCEAANVEPPKRNQPNTPAAASNNDVRIGKAVWLITQKLASENPSALKQFQADRGYTNEQMAAMRLGYYTTPEDLIARLKPYGYTLNDAAERGYVELDDNGTVIPGLAGRVIGYWPHTDGDDRLWGRIPVGAGDRKVKKYKFAAKLKKDIPYLYNQRKQGVLVCVEGTMDAWALQLSDIWGCAVGGAQINTAQALHFQQRGISEVAHMVDGDNAGWNGALLSIKNCETLNIVTSIIPLGAGMDDADALLRAGKSETLKAQVAKRMNAGRYLALMLRAQYQVAAPDLQAINRIHATADCLTPTSKIVFDELAARFGIRPDLRLEAGRLLGELLRAGLNLNEAIGNVTRRTGYTITIEKEVQHG